MAAGLGFKTFVTGDVLTATDTNGYLMQGVLVFASAAARDSAITSPQEGQFAYLKDTNVTTYYTGSAWANLDTTGMTNPMTTTGDTIYSSSGSTPARLGIGSTGQVLTVASGIPSWATPSSSVTFVGTTVSKSSAQSVSTSTQTAVTWNVEAFDTDSIHSTSSNTSRFTIPTGKGGYWQINPVINWADQSASGVRQLKIYKNGSVIKSSHFYPTSAGTMVATYSIVLSAVAADYFEVYVFQNSGTSVNIYGDDADSQMSNCSMTYLGA